MSKQDICDAVGVIRELAAQGHAFAFIAGALTRRGIPTPAGRAEWHKYMVTRIATKNGISVRWRPTAHAIGSARASARVGVDPCAESDRGTA